MDEANRNEKIDSPRANRISQRHASSANVWREAINTEEMIPSSSTIE